MLRAQYREVRDTGKFTPTRTSPAPSVRAVSVDGDESPSRDVNMGDANAGAGAGSSDGPGEGHAAGNANPSAGDAQGFGQVDAQEHHDGVPSSSRPVQVDSGKRRCVEAPEAPSVEAVSSGRICCVSPRFSCSVRISGVGWWCWWFSGGFGVGVARGGVEGGLSHCLRFSSREMGGGAAPGSTNSWSDTAYACCPTGTLCIKGGVSGPAEDLLPVSEVEAGVNVRPAGGVRGQVAGSLPGRQPGTGTRQVRTGAVTPSLHPEVPGIQFVSPGHGLDIRQSMDWTKVCGTAQSGIWVLKGTARTCMFPANLDHLRVGWRKQGSYETAWVTPGHDCLCSYAYGHGTAVRPQTNDAIWHGVTGLCCRVAPLLSPWCAKREVPTGVNLNRYSGPSSCVRWHRDGRALVRPTE